MISSFFNAPEDFPVIVTSFEKSTEGICITFEHAIIDSDTGEGSVDVLDGYEFLQDDSCTEAGIAVYKYGALMIPASAEEASINLAVLYMGVRYQTSTAISNFIENCNVGASFTLIPNGIIA